MPAPIKKEDYKQIFRSSTSSSIPILELSDTNDLVNLKTSEINYNDVFSAVSGDEQAIGVSYQDLLSANLRTQSALESPLKRSDHPAFPEENQLLSAEASSLTFDDKKHFSMSYQKTSAGSQDGSNGTIHVAQFHPEPGFTIFVDDSSPQESKTDKPDSSDTSDIRRKLDFSDRKPEDRYTKKAMQHIDPQRSSRREANSKTGLQQDGSVSSDKLRDADVVNLRPNLTKKRHPPYVAENNNDFTKRSTVSNSEAPESIASKHATGDGFLPFLSEELDVNSAAAISAAALKDAIQKAQKIIQIAKKLMERKKSGLYSRSNQAFKDGLRVEVRKQIPIEHEENRTDNIKSKDTCDYVDSLLNAFSWRWKSALRREEDDLYFRTSTLGKVRNAQNRSTNEKREPALSTALNIGNNRTASPEQQVVMNKHEYVVGKRDSTGETLMKQEVIVEKEGQNEKAHESDIIKKKVHAVVMDNELEDSANKLAKDVKMENPLMPLGDGDSEKMKFEFVVLKDSDYEKMTCKTQKQDHDIQKVNFQQHSEKTTANIKEEPEHRPRTICDEGLEESFEDAVEWVQNEDETMGSPGSSSNENGKKDTYMAEVIWGERRLAESNNPTIEEKRATDFNGRKECEENYGKFELRGSENGFESCNKYEKTENIQTGTKKLEAIQQDEYECTDNRESGLLNHDASDNIIEIQGDCQPYMCDAISKAKQQVNDKSRNIDTAAKEFCDFQEGEEEEAKVMYKVQKIEHFETISLVQGATEENEDKKMKNVFEVIASEGSIPGFGPTDSDLENKETKQRNKETKQRNKDFESNINPDDGTQISRTGSIEKDRVLKEDEIYLDEKAVKSNPDISNVEGQHVVNLKNFEACPGSILSSEIEKVIQVEEMSERHKTQMNGDSYCRTIEEEEENIKTDKEMATEIVVECDDDNPKVEVAMKGTKTEKVASKGVEENEYLRKIHEESKRKKQRERDGIAVEAAIQEARDRAVAVARERAERAIVERATAEVRQRMMAEARGKLEKATTTAKLPAEKVLVGAKVRSERAAVERATAEARARALEKALSENTTRDTAMKDLHKSDETYIESAQRSKARLEREQRIRERAEKALAAKNMRDLLAQKEEAEKNRLAESLDAEVKRWSTGKEGNLRALLSTLQYILGPGSGWQPISLTDIVMSNAVKKAYRKATLHVHPDKLQQRGASIREKYICEKVFDLLKIAWNRFSSEER